MAGISTGPMAGQTVLVTGGTGQATAVWFYQRLSAACAKHGQ
jgi:hypothetical protein